MLRFVASGPFPLATAWGTAGVCLGLLVHFALMAVMVCVFVFAATKSERLIAHPFLAGVTYGLVTYGILNLVIVPLRFARPLPPAPVAIATQLFAHIVLVGLPLAYLARRRIQRRMLVPRASWIFPKAITRQVPHAIRRALGQDWLPVLQPGSGDVDFSSTCFRSGGRRSSPSAGMDLPGRAAKRSTTERCSGSGCACRATSSSWSGGCWWLGTFLWSCGGSLRLTLTWLSVI